MRDKHYRRSPGRKQKTPAINQGFSLLDQCKDTNMILISTLQAK